MWTDSHCHLTDGSFDEDRDAVLGKAREEGVTRLVLIGCEEGQFAPVLDYVRGHPGLVAVLGYHPAEAGLVGPEGLDLLDGLLADPAVRAVGEVGLDYHWAPEKRDVQRDLFEAQIALAKRRDAPLVIHERDAWGDAIALLAEASSPVLLHCFSHTKEEARLALDRGWHLALGGAVTFRSAADLRDVATYVPLDRLLVETDAPYLAPHPYRGRRNEPGRVAVTGRFIADLRGMPHEELARRTTENAKSFFGPWDPMGPLA